MAAAVDANSFIARQASNNNNTVSCGLETLCTDIGLLPADETIQQACPSLIACCAQTGLGIDGGVSENCTFPTDIPTSDMFLEPSRMGLHSADLHRFHTWYDAWNKRDVAEEWDGLYLENDQTPSSGTEVTIFSWKGPQLGWVADNQWGRDAPLLFHTEDDDGLPPVDFSLPALPRAPRPTFPGTSPPVSPPTSPEQTIGRKPSEEEIIQQMRKRRPMKRWKGA
ncbi:hypothetical protein DACRYDRAFT_15721 [Dacryopinax primogenitus]|uniref:Uncharacterized protein n=1 Tax=Dacryopinax primogenitus (strain DJM 731) TaxID=1858805 RepID=M5G9C7_DACPD|nr:uncharacterized protein DACRYDRAFT_15721 [Dacryopinax primogenitus]EJU02467.1 hypothetical protein DACRYDRAFT_15721 [Dacryopinax primogenitus]